MLQLKCKNQGQVVYYYYSGTLFEIENRESDDWALLYAEYCIIGNPIVVYLVTPPPSKLLSASDHFYSCPAPGPTS